MRADEVELDENERELVDGEELEGRDMDDDDEDEEEGMKILPLDGFLFVCFKFSEVLAVFLGIFRKLGFRPLDWVLLMLYCLAVGKNRGPC